MGSPSGASSRFTALRCRTLSRTRLYRISAFAVTLLAGVICGAQGNVAQYGHKAQVSKGPRALGLIQLFPNGKAHLIPVAISVDGKFFDAGSYKGSPVPMALDFGVVYEGFRTGVSLGTFTITQPGQAGHVWMAEGTWLAAGAKAAQKGMKYETPKIEDKEAPPRLHRGESKPAAKAGDEKPSTPPSAPKTTDNKVQEPALAAQSANSDSKNDPNLDPNRPVLRRGKPDPATRHELVKNFDEEPVTGKSPELLANVQIIPAISDAAGPDPRPFNFDLRGNEEAGYRTKMLALASTELAKAHAAPAEIQSAKPQRPASARKAVPATFEEVKLRIFDLSNSNDPVLILSAKTRHPATSNGAASYPEEIMLIARPNLEGDLRRLFFSHTDALHLDVTPRMELIDAVDADGDGRGELLFRRTTDAGSSYAIYRAMSDRLWPLYEGTP